MLIMLSLEQYQILKNELTKETAKEFVKTLLDMYANNVENVSDLLSYIPQLAEKQLAIKQTIINQYSWSTDLLISDRHLHPHKYKKNEGNNQFCTLLYTCKAHFLTRPSLRLLNLYNTIIYHNIFFVKLYTVY